MFSSHALCCRSLVIARICLGTNFHWNPDFQTLMDSSITWRMNSVPSVWGPKHSIWARCMEGVRKAAAHCSTTVGSHSWWRTEAARFPTFWSSHSASHRRAGPHSWDWAEQAQRWGAVSGCAPQRRHVVSSTVSRWEDRCAKTVIVGMLSMRCAAIWRCWFGLRTCVKNKTKQVIHGSKRSLQPWEGAPVAPVAHTRWEGGSDEEPVPWRRVEK
jgi:hypothetical protein